MIELNKALKFLENFSIITVSENKLPNFGWKEFQTLKMNPQIFSNRYNYQGGEIKKDGSERPKTENFGIVTGFEDLEVLDIDLKVFKTAIEQREFWNEFEQNLKDNILDFEDKIVIYKTKNAGYHLLYKTKLVQGNLKIAKLQGHKECVIETRGIGGYVFAYPENRYSKKSYFDIDYITDEERQIIMSFSKMYNYVEHEPEFKIDKKTKSKNVVNENEITPWDDFNEKMNVWDLILTEFTIPSNGVKNKHIVIRRNGAQSPHSGYIFKDSGCMFLFSTGTIYPNEKLLSPFAVYAYQKHNGNFSEAGSELYKQGFGTRKEKEAPKELSAPKKEKANYDVNDLNFPIDIFPDAMKNYILECNEKLDSNIDYLGSSLIWLISVCIGNSIEMEVKRGWNENATVWLSLVGKAGIGKTPSINNIIFPLLKQNNLAIKKYYTELDKYEEYSKLSEKDKKDFPEVEKPIKTQFIANDITLEALVDLLQENPNGVGVFKDEQAGWLKDMNKYRAGSDLEFWLSSWSGKTVNLNRMTRRGSFVEKPFIPVLGGIQPSILNSLYTQEHKDNGFMDRMLLSFPDAKVECYNENEIDYSIISWYKESIIRFFEALKMMCIKDDNGNIVPSIGKFSNDAKKEWIRIFNRISTTQNSDDESEYLKSMYPKQKSYVPRFALIIHVFNEFFINSKELLLVSKESVLKAEKLSNYFIAMAKKIKADSNEVTKIKSSVLSNKGKNEKEQLFEIWKADKDFNKTQTAEILSVSRMTIIRWIKEFEGITS